MFRVLSEEESRNVTRWQAPEIGSGTAAVANTRQQANPQQPDQDASVRALLGSLDLKPESFQSTSSAPQLKPISPIDVVSTHALLRGQKTAGSASSDADVPVSAELMQSSYDEGYSLGYAQGNAALHQHSVKELRTVISALSAAAKRPEDADLEHELVALTLDIARLVIRREVSLAPEIMHSIVSAGLEQLTESSTVQRVYLHPLDANIVRDHLPPDSVVRVLDDPLLVRGGCRIESGSSVVNAGIEDWISTVSAQLGVTADIDTREAELPE